MMKIKIETPATPGGGGDDGGEDLTPAGAIVDTLRGAGLRELDERDPEYGRVPGVLVAMVDEGSPAALNGLIDDDVITAVNKQPVASIPALSRALKAAKTPLALNVRRDGSRVYVVIR